MTFKTKPPDTLRDHDNVSPLILVSAIPAVNSPNFLMIRIWQDLSEIGDNMGVAPAWAVMRVMVMRGPEDKTMRPLWLVLGTNINVSPI